MRKVCWLFIIGVALIDIRFTACCREAELNPVARGLIELGGIPAMVAYRAIWILIAILASRTGTRLSPYVLPVWFGGHMVLLTILLESFWESQK
jgi:hypothetical protein